MALLTLHGVLYGAIIILSGVSSQMSFWAMGQKMPAYPSFLLIVCNGLYAIAFFVVMLVSQALGGTGDAVAACDDKSSGEEAAASKSLCARLCGSRPEQRFFVFVGIGTGLSLELQQLANGQVNPDMQSVLYQLYLPFTALCSMLYLRTRLGLWELAGGVLVFAGAVCVVAPGIAGGTSLVGAVVYGLSTLPLGMACVLQEETFKLHFTDALQMAFWSTFYGTLLNAICIPLTMVPRLITGEDGPIFPHGASLAQLGSHSADAFDCFLGVAPLPEGCKAGAWLPVVLYALSYGINVYVAMLLVKEVDAVTCVLIGAVVVPGTAIAAALPAILSLYGIGDDGVTPLTWFVVVGGLVCVAGIVVFSRRGQSAKKEEDDGTEDETDTESEMSRA